MDLRTSSVVHVILKPLPDISSPRLLRLSGQRRTLAAPGSHFMNDPKLLIVMSYVVVAPLLGLVEPWAQSSQGNDPRHGFPSRGPGQLYGLVAQQSSTAPRLTPGVEVEH